MPQADRWQRGRLKPVLAGSCSLYAYNDNRESPTDYPRFIGRIENLSRRAATATPLTPQFLKEVTWSFYRIYSPDGSRHQKRSTEYTQYPTITGALT